jgi:hypothetical protein
MARGPGRERVSASLARRTGAGTPDPSHGPTMPLR